MTDPVTAGLVIIGDEILSGRTQDTNTATIAAWLGDRGIQLREVRVVPDVEAEIVAAVNGLRGRYTYLFTTGGIGPTHDDITAASVAAAFGLPFGRHAEAEARLRAHYGDETLLTPARLSMADMPAGAVLIENPVSGAPGFQIDNVFVMAGVPKIMRAMLDSLEPRLTGGAPVLARTVTCVGKGEGDIAATLEAVLAAHPRIGIGSYPYFRAGGSGVSLVLRGTDEPALATAAADLADRLRGLGADSAVVAISPRSE